MNIGFFMVTFFIAPKKVTKKGRLGRCLALRYTSLVQSDRFSDFFVSTQNFFTVPTLLIASFAYAKRRSLFCL
jgi:hypothetical protein